MRIERLAPAVLLGVLGVLGIRPALAGGPIEVQVRMPATTRIDTTGMSRLLVGGFRANDHPRIDLDREIGKQLRSLYRKKTRFEVLDVESLPLPEQPLEDVIRNTAYWKRLGARFNADLIVGGTIDFSSRDQSGFVQEDIIQELTLHRQRRSRWVDRESFKLELGLYFFRGSSGELLYEDHFSEEAAFLGKEADDLTVLLDLFERIGGGTLSILTPTRRVETRYLFTE